MKRLALITALAIVCFALGRPAEARVVGKTIMYSANGVTMKGYLATDPALKGKRPGILVVHEWWGLTNYARKRARMLAGLGYTALAVDLYGNGRTVQTPAEASALATERMKDFTGTRARFLAAEEVLKKDPTVDPHRLAGVGYCFGGGVLLNMARTGTDLRGVVSVHGDLQPVATAAPGSITPKILVFQGTEDRFAPAAAIKAFREEMTKAKAHFRVVLYPHAMHAFSNPKATALGKKFKLPIAYNKSADRKSWSAMKRFFAGLFAQK